MTCNSKTTYRGAKVSEIFDWQLVVTCIPFTFHWGHGVDLSHMACKSERIAVERNGLKFGTRE